MSHVINYVMNDVMNDIVNDGMNNVMNDEMTGHLELIISPGILQVYILTAVSANISRI